VNSFITISQFNKFYTPTKTKSLISLLATKHIPYSDSNPITGFNTNQCHLNYPWIKRLHYHVMTNCLRGYQ
jgi:hypothetical protein